MENNSKYCPKWERILAATHLDDLSPVEREAFDCHLASCPNCKAVLTENQKMDILLRSAFLPKKRLPSWQELIQRKCDEEALTSSDSPTATASNLSKNTEYEVVNLPQTVDAVVQLLIHSYIDENSKLELNSGEQFGNGIYTDNVAQFPLSALADRNWKLELNGDEQFGSDVTVPVLVTSGYGGHRNHSNDNPSHFDLSHLLNAWMNISMRDYRKGRHFLEDNTILIEHGSDEELERLIVAQVEDHLEMKQQKRYLLALLRNARRNARQRGGTAQAISEAYVNTYGGFVLDLPLWLKQAEEDRSLLIRLRRSERTTRRHVLLLEESIQRVQQDKAINPEVIAELQNELGYTLLQGPHAPSHQEQLQILERAISCHEAALLIYTYERYPLQYGRTRVQLGLAYQHYGVASKQREFIERAIASFKDALWVYDRQTFPEQWAMLQTHVGCAYLQSEQGKLHDNHEYAISCHKHAIETVQRETFPTVWATAQINLGDAYRQRTVGDHADNLKHAIQCFLNALQVFVQKDFPREWAVITTKLASIFQYTRAEEVDMSEDMNLRCAVVCYENALTVYTSDAFPVERAVTQVRLGNVYRRRTCVTARENLELARQYYLAALQVFTEQAFPLEHRQTLHNLKETERLLQS